MKGIDISSYQGTIIDFKKVKASDVEIVYIKATEGVTFDSPGFGLQYAQARAAGLKIGFYHYMRANDPEEEAKHFIKATDGLHVDCKYAIDIEQMDNQTVDKVSNNVRKFADYMISQGKEVCIYTGDSFYANNLNHTVKNIPIWIAHYGVIKPNITGYVGFQYSSKGNVDGIKGNVDLNVFENGILMKDTTNNIILASKPVAKTTGSEVIKILQRELNKQYNSRLDVDGWGGNLTLGACPTMREGARGNITKWLQKRLSFKLEEQDGIFGPHTLAAVKKYQRALRLSADGIVGENTWRQLLK
ncbi:GH25 family lysozyme [Clostridium sp.]|uniref:GH25 family lysozyme n=1 Tax=Clostridium sp. TaxID=1506 RepID=UPI001A42BD7B|nr:GH25 family lysozyme [Clostridium sp.]MBK5243051.1 peptidoglycan-binding protein [Clostridium sp.]